ncbi:MAG: DsbA family protein, partial [Gammaproteobacteria bacterium]|nr:DsbA family protein [Gammaproteobacteria bacterium]
MNPSEPVTLTKLAGELGLDSSLFKQDLVSGKTEKAFQGQLALRRELGVRSFPSLVLEHRGAVKPINHDYHDHGSSLAEIRKCLSTGDA